MICDIGWSLGIHRLNLTPENIFFLERTYYSIIYWFCIYYFNFTEKMLLFFSWNWFHGKNNHFFVKLIFTEKIEFFVFRFCIPVSMSQRFQNLCTLNHQLLIDLLLGYDFLWNSCSLFDFQTIQIPNQFRNPCQNRYHFRYPTLYPSCSFCSP